VSRRTLLAALALALPATAQDEAAPETAAAPEQVAPAPVPAPAAPLEPGGASEGAIPTPEAVLARLERLVEAHPGRLRLEVIGRSAGERPLVVAALGSTAPAAPGLLVGDHLAGDDPTGGEAALALVESLVSAPAGALPDGVALFVAPDLDPDRRARLAAGEEAGPGPRWNLGFPLGWQPEGLRPGGGDLPLADPGARALVAFLDAHPAISVALGVGRGEAGEPAPADPVDLRTHRGLARAWAVQGARPPLHRAAPRVARGGWLDWCWEGRGIHALVVDPRGADPAALLAGVPDLAACLPALRLEVVGVERLAPELWGIDLALTNPGVVPTLSTLGSLRSCAGDVTVRLEGADVLGAALASEGAVDHTVRSLAGVELRVGQLDGGEGVRLRFVVRRGEEPRVTLAASSARGGSADAAFEFPVAAAEEPSPPAVNGAAPKAD
jgi:hypothetical protein